MKSERLTETSGKNLCRTKEYYPSLTAFFGIENRQTTNNNPGNHRVSGFLGENEVV